MNDTQKSLHDQISELDESFGQISSRTNTCSCASQDADLSEDGINDECGCGCGGECQSEQIREAEAVKEANAEIASLNQSFGEITAQTNENPYANQDAEFDEDGLDSDALLKTREEEEGELENR